jgi:hypothetical protein
METENGTRSDSGPLDDFTKLCRKNSDASVSATMGYALAYGAGKCSVTVTTKCAQDEKTIEKATRLAMVKADQLAREGMSIVMAYLESNEGAEA